jgi:hypothetical protein
MQNKAYRKGYFGSEIGRRSEFLHTYIKYRQRQHKILTFSNHPNCYEFKFYRRSPVLKSIGAEKNFGDSWHSGQCKSEVLLKYEIYKYFCFILYKMFLVLFTKLRKTNISSVMFVRPSVSSHGTTRIPLDGCS